MTVPADVPKDPSRAYKAFRGEVPSYEQPLSGATFRIENTEIAGRRWCRLIGLDKNAAPITQLSKGARYKI